MTYMNRFKLIYILLLTALLAGGSMKTMAGVVVRGNVYGGGNQAGVQVNTEVNMSTGAVYGNVYGGGNLGDVGNIDKTNIRAYTWTDTDGAANGTTPANNTGVCTVTITGGTIGPDGTPDEHHGNVFGAGKGVDDTFWCEKGMVYKTVVSISNSTVKRNVYGGGEVGRVDNNTTVTIGPETGTSNTDIKGSVFGAGAGVKTHGYSALVRGNTYVTVQGDARVEENVYGGGQIAAVGKYNLVTKTNQSEHPELEVGMPYSLVDENLGICNVTIQGSADIAGNVFGAGQGVVPKADYGYTVTQVDGKYVYDMPCRMMSYDSDVYKDANLHHTWEYAENYPLDYDGSKYVWEYFDTEAKYLTFVETLALATQTVVIIGENDKETKVGGSVYGGSENGFVQHHVSLTIQGDCEIGTNTAGGYVYGGGRGLEGYPTLGRVSGNTMVSINGGTMHSSVYGGGQMGIVKGGVSVSMTDGAVNQDVYGGGALADTNTGNWNEYVLVTDLTAGSSPVTDLYEKSGRGYASTSDEIAVEGKAYYNKVSTWADATEKSALNVTTVNLLGGTIMGDAYGGGLGRRAQTDVTPVEATVYGEVKINLNGIDKSYYDAADATQQTVYDTYITKPSGKTEYPLEESRKGAIVNRVFGANNANGSPKGNVTVHVFATQSRNASKATIKGKFINDNDDYEQGGNEAIADYIVRLQTALTGWIELAEALSISVSNETKALKTAEVPEEEEDQNTRKKDIKDAIDDLMESVYEPAHSTALNNLIYDVKAVYGGGNEATYVPMSTNTAEIITENGITDPNGPITKVIIEGCEVTTIETVYGGGNAASVPETYVNVKSAYEIETVFGGGNGKDATSYGANPGADVGVYKNSSNTEVRYGTGHTNSHVQGGYIHELFGASNEKGQIKGSPKIKSEEEGDCPMVIGTVYNAGKNADIDGDMIAILGCMPSSKIKEYYGGAQNANVKGNVELTITSGNFGKVFAGNKTSGSIFGHIKINIEETGNCDVPIRIDELYGCGNEAAYSVYGYYQAKKKEVTKTVEGQSVTSLFMDVDGTIPLYEDGGNYYKDEGKTIRLYKDGSDNLYINEEMTRPLYMPRRSANDNNVAVFFGDGTSNDHTKPNASTGQYANPEVNIISCTHIGKVFGGGYGTGAVVYGDPHVNINMLQGSNSSNITNTDGNNPNQLGAIGDVYGGGNAADIIGNTFVNIGTETTVDLVSTGEEDQPVLGAYITGNVYGGGKGEADNFFCNKAMVGEDGKGVNADFTDNPNYEYGNTHVTIGNGTVGTLDSNGKLVEGTGNVYGGGEIGRVEKNTTVTIGIDLGEGNTSAPIIRGDVFGGGKGKKTHGYAALVRGNPTVTIQEDAKVGHSVYGAGEIASVARYRVPRTTEEVEELIDDYPNAQIGMPIALLNSTCGYCTVTVKGNAEIGPDNMKMYHKVNGDIPSDDKPDDAGHVFAAGKGFLPEGNWGYNQNDKNTMPRRMVLYDATKFTTSNQNLWEYVSATDHNNVWEYFPSRDEYVKFIQTQALASNTEVSIEGNAFVKGSVYGGSENGLVQYDTKVYIKGGQIGCGKNTTHRHVTDYPTVWNDNFELPDGVDLECASWEYKAPYAPYDPNAKYYDSTNEKYCYDSEHNLDAAGGAIIASDGHTYYGNVFGGGSGSVPYFDTKEGISKYLNTAGTVKGNTTVEITGGHILTNVYGGCESTNVLGKTTVKMTGGTLGVPRTVAQIQAHPVTCYLFGAGKGDQRIFFNKDTNVNDAEVEVDGGRIYGSVFGGGEDGHVMRHTKVTIKQSSGKTTKIGTTGTTYVDGNVFGGGRGFGGDALTAGNIGGCVEVNIEGGTMLGSVYGGGRLASVGYGLYLSTGTEASKYGKMRADNEFDDPDNPTSTTQSAEDFFKTNPFTPGTFTPKGRGYIVVNVSGGTIGNLVDTAQYGGHVFGGSMGRLKKLDDSPFDSDHWKLLATAKKTTVNITGSPIIRRSVFGGGEMGTVTTDAIVNVSGGTIGTTDKGGAEFGNVYGGGKGYFDRTAPNKTDYVLAGIVKGNTTVTIENGTSTSPEILHNVYGGGAYGSVGTITLGNATYVPGQSSVGNMPTVWEREVNNTGTDTGTATVTITGGTIGTDGHNNGMVFGSSRGDVSAPTQVHDHMAWVYNSHVIIGTSGTETPTIRGSVYGSGENGHVFQNTIVDIHGGTIGMLTTPDADDEDDEPLAGPNYPSRGNVYGGGCGTDKYHSTDTETYLGDGDTYNALAGIVLGTATVNIDGGLVVHNVYGAGAMGSVGTMTTASNDRITISSDTGKTTIDISGGTVGVDGTENGHVFGAARGDAVSTQTGVSLVKTTDVKISGTSTIIRGNVYGGGEAGDVGTYYTVAADGDGKYKGDNVYLGDENSGVCNVTISNGTINGHVFGAGKGEANTFTCQKAMAKSANVTIKAGTIGKNVYGGGEVGRVEYDTHVTIGDASGTSTPAITGSVFGAGAGVETHGYSALVRGNTYVTVQNHATVGHSVYGGGQIASVGKYGLNTQKMPEILKGGGYCYVNVKGDAAITGDVFGAGKGITPVFNNNSTDRSLRSRRMTMYNEDDFPSNAMISAETGTASGTTTQGTTWEYYESGSPYVWEYYQEESDYLTYLETLALATHPEVTIEGNATIGNDVYGGGERGITKGSVIVNINGGSIARDVYGGGALANTNTTSTVQTIVGNEVTTETVHPTTTVNLHGGTVNRHVYGGGLGQKEGVNGGTSDVEALVYGDVLVKLNETTNSDNCVVKGNIFGCNNINGTPKGDVTVHVYKTQGWTDHSVNKNDDTAKGSGVYELAAVYGGGNQASYYPVDPNKNRSTEVIIDGCALTSIGTVYGGGNAASVPGTHVTVNSCYEIGTVFGGGNGAGVGNPGANVGYKPVTYSYTYQNNSSLTPEQNAAEEEKVRLAALKAAFEEQKSTLIYGSGKALVDLIGGTVNKSFGGSNTLGDVRVSATVDMHEDATASDNCPLNLDVVYGAGNESEQTGDSKICLTCITKLNEVYAGANKADVKGNVEMTIQSGQYNRVFGGNNESGEIKGNITVNIEETGCYPIIIGQLYGAGNMAKYADGRNDGKVIVNAKSFTSIGEIYGGGYGSGATVNGNTYVYVNEFVGDHASEGMKTEEGHTDESLHTGETRTLPNGYEVEMPLHKSGDIGAVGTIYGGGNAATVNGNTHVYIGTKTEEFQAKAFEEGASVTGYYTLNANAEGTSSSDYTLINSESAKAEAGTTYYEKKAVIGADIRGNVYGGGNAAVVTGNTNVTIGKEPTVTTPSGGSGSGSGSGGSGGSGGGSGSGG